MEEIDGIILDSLRNLNCDFEEDVTSLKHFDAGMIVPAISTCLEAILPHSSFPKKLPPTMSLKLKITSNLADQIKDLGFRDDIGYQTILYCNEVEIRRVLMFLIERLPRETSKTGDVEQTGYVPTLVKNIEKNVKRALQELWVPSCILRNGCRPYEGGNLVHSFGDSRPLQTKKLHIPNSRESYKDEGLKQFWIHNVPAVTKQCTPKELIPSLLFNDGIINWNDPALRALLKINKKDEVISMQIVDEAQLLHKDNGTIATESNVSAQEKKENHSENKLLTLVKTLKERQGKCVELQEAIRKHEAQLNQVTNLISEENDKLSQTLAQVSLKNKTLTVISKEENFDKLKNLIENGKDKLIDLTEQWHKIQSPLLEEYKSIQNTLNSEDLKLQKHQSKLRKLKETQKLLTSDLKDKVQLEEQLRTKLEQINKTHNRSGYTRRILEIIGNIKKQDEEIQKILIDTKSVQREISSLTGKVDRSFTQSDELIFRDAKVDETARKAYKLLAQLRDECSSIIKAVTDLGSIERECRNLQEQIDSETIKDSAVKFERVSKDLQEIRRETELLLKKSVL